MRTGGKKMVRFICFWVLFLMLSTVNAQQNNFIEHTIKEGETLFALAKTNQTTVGDIMRLNGMDSKSKLKTGQVIKIPLAKKIENVEPVSKPTPIKDTLVKSTPKPINIPKQAIEKKGEDKKVETKNKTAVAEEPRDSKQMQPLEQGEESIIEYKVEKGDNIFKIAKKFNVTEPQVMRWNSMATDKVNVGKKLLIHVKAAIPATPNGKTPSDKALVPQIVQTPTKPKPIDTATVKKQIVSPPPAPATKVLPNLSQGFKKSDSLPVKQKDTVWPKINQDTLVKKILPVFIDTPSLKISTKDSVLRTFPSTVKKDTVVQKKDTLMEMVKSIFVGSDSLSTKKAVEKMMTQSEPILDPSNSKYVNQEGFFAAYFNRNDTANNPITGDGGYFKSSGSGWTDKKYYVLINDIPQGTILRITYNNKSICAKVIGPLPPVKADTGYLLRVNSAAAAVLNVDGKFPITVNY